MRKVSWSDRASTAYARLSPEDQREVDRHVELLRQFPELYQRVETGRYRGKRRFPARRRWHVLYDVAGECRDCFIIAIRPARAKPE